MADQPKFDFENIDIKLFLALKGLTKDWVALAQDAGNREAESDPDYQRALLAMQEFEMSHGPIPPWAKERNWAYELIPGAQLCTRDGRKTGNAHIIDIEHRDYPGQAGLITVYRCITDAGSIFAFTEQEIETGFYVGDWISDVADVLAKFDREKWFSQPK